MLDVHDRQPIVFAPALALEWWLAPATPKECVEEMLQAGEPAEVFEWFRVDKAVSNVRHDYRGIDLADLIDSGQHLFHHGRGALASMYSKGSLMIFLLVGPLVAGLAMGGGRPGAGSAWPIIYVFGLPFAGASWLIYSTVFHALHKVVPTSPVIGRLLFGNISFLLGGLVGAAAGYLLFTWFGCSRGLAASGPWSCALQSFTDHWGLSVLPGAICGGISSANVVDRRAPR